MIQVTFGAAQHTTAGLIAAVLPAAVAAAAALGGVWITNRANERRHRTEEQKRREERLADLEAAEASFRRDRGLAALALAEHLEDFVLECVDVVSSVGETVWDGPYQVAEHSPVQPKFLSDFKPWPDLVDWKLLGLEAAVRAAAFRRKLMLEDERLMAASDHLSAEEVHQDAGAMATDLGLEAWALAYGTRRNNNIAAFVWEAGWSGVEMLERHKARATKRREQEALAMIDLDALGEPDDGDEIPPPQVKEINEDPGEGMT